MPPRRRAPGTPQEWLARAKSNLIMARREKTEDLFWEDLCFETQQAAEKALKAVCQHRGILFRYVHDLEELITTLEKHDVIVPEKVKEAEILSQYAFETRYPGDFESLRDTFPEACFVVINLVDLMPRSLLRGFSLSHRSRVPSRA